MGRMLKYAIYFYFVSLHRSYGVIRECLQSHSILYLPINKIFCELWHRLANTGIFWSFLAVGKITMTFNRNCSFELAGLISVFLHK